jgi:zinc transporter ZupT
VIPFSKKKIYKKILLGLIGIAVGSLAGSGFLHLIPQAFGISDDIKYSKDHGYIWKGLVIMGGVYLFFVVEKFLKIMLAKKKFEKNKNKNKKVLRKRSSNDMLENIGYFKPNEQPAQPNVEMRTRISETTLNQVRFI